MLYEKEENLWEWQMSENMVGNGTFAHDEQMLHVHQCVLKPARLNSVNVSQPGRQINALLCSSEFQYHVPCLDFSEHT